jgi:hypothetical protein
MVAKSKNYPLKTVSYKFSRIVDTPEEAIEMVLSSLPQEFRDNLDVLQLFRFFEFKE